MQRLIDADELIRNLESIISDYTSNGIYPEKFGIDDFIDVVKEIPTLPAPQWISVEDNPPGNEYDFVLAYKPYLHEMGGSGMIVEHPWFVRMNKTYKYWMPLPEPPEEVKDEWIKLAGSGSQMFGGVSGNVMVIVVSLSAPLADGTLKNMLEIIISVPSVEPPRQTRPWTW